MSCGSSSSHWSAGLIPCATKRRNYIAGDPGLTSMASQNYIAGDEEAKLRNYISDELVKQEKKQEKKFVCKKF